MTLQRAAFWAAAIAVPLGIASDVLYAAAAHFPIDPAAINRFDVLAADPALLRWAAFTDFCAFYAPLVPVALYLRRRLDGRDPLLDVYTIAALAFAVIGGTAALVLGAVGPALAIGAATAGPVAAATYSVVAKTLEDAVYVAIWQTFGAIALGIFYIGVGRLLRRERRWLGALTIFIGADALVVAVARVAGLEPVAIVTIAVWLPLLTFWSGWLAFSVLREGRPDLALTA